ncbi:phosphoketolase [Thiobacillus sp.]|uniref:phosphoketolase n=1 Tax=Thiobacillus sp. TaxID=924 RepID=UPI0017930FA0|nr:phosphoketolase [Thiobacillus sp.]MBC2729862.1 phosphoketolase [Thiobacillus sp.]MBC2738598.1 phosphoketolase [Thiobacillus sp.]MBC2761122.1 phosphoketolase [Thiobacillus sp.]
MSAQMQSTPETFPAFCEGIQYFADSFPEIDRLGAAPLLGPTQPALPDATSEAAVYQTLLAADALRYLTLQVTGSKSSGHPGGFASSADAVAALHLLGHRNMVTEVGHHAPGFYSAMFLDTSLEAMGIQTVAEMRTRFRERHGLLGHLSGAIPGLLAPAGPLGQGQHFAMAGAYLHRDKLFPVTIGDGGLGEPYIMSAFQHFATAYPDVTNYLPVLVWNGYSQEHHSMVSLWDNTRMTDYWRAHGFDEVHLIDARDYADTPDAPAYTDSTTFGFAARMAFTGAILKAADAAAQSALSGRRACLIVKQLKGAGVHATGAKSHNLYAHHTLDSDDVKGGLQRRALPTKAWEITRENFRHAGGGPAARVAVTESVRDLPSLDGLPLTEFAVGENHVPTTAFGHVVGEVGKRDPMFVVTNADGNEASGMANINKALTIRHPTADDLYFQGPSGQVYEPLNEDACAGLAVGIALFGGRSLWCSYESFAINGLPIWQTVTQAMAELRRKTPATVCLFTAGALEQGRNGWTHQRPEIESYFAAMMRNGNVYPLFPVDANMIQASYDWALKQHNKGIVITASKSPLPVRTSLAQGEAAIEQGAIVLHEHPGKKSVVFAVTGDMVLQPVFAAAEKLAESGIGSRIVAVVNPRRLYRPGDVLWGSVSEPDDRFMDDDSFKAMFQGDVLLGISGGPSAPLEPVLLRSQAAQRDVFCWKRGETTASPQQLFDFNGMNAQAMSARVLAMLERTAS